eukprot:1159834-Pelagomonas_calceolata.AAC.1
MQHVRLYTRTELASPKMYGTCCVLQDACEREDTDDAADGPSLQVAPRTSSAPALQCHPPATGGKGRTYGQAETTLHTICVCADAEAKKPLRDPSPPESKQPESLCKLSRRNVKDTAWNKAVSMLSAHPSLSYTDSLLSLRACFAPYSF